MQMVSEASHLHAMETTRSPLFAGTHHLLTMQGKARRAVVPFIINITMEINFSSKIYSKSLLKGLHGSCLRSTPYPKTEMIMETITHNISAVTCNWKPN